MEITLELHSTYLQRTAGSKMMHCGMRDMKVLSVVPLSSVQASAICGCPLQATAVDTKITSKELIGTEQSNQKDGSMWFDAARKSNWIKARALGMYLLETDCVLVIQCHNEVSLSFKIFEHQHSYHLQDRAEFYLCVPSAEFRTQQPCKPIFLIFRIVSAEEILLSPQIKNEEENVTAESEETQADLDTLSKCFHQMQAKRFNPFEYQSVITCIRPATQIEDDPLTNARHKPQAAICSKGRLRQVGLPYTPLPIVKRRKQL